MDVVNKLGKVTEGWNTVSESVDNLMSQIPGDLQLKLDTMSKDLSSLGQTMKDLATQEDLATVAEAETGCTGS